MALAKHELVMELARLAGLWIAEEEAGEVADRLFGLLEELEKLNALDLTSIEPVVVFPDSGNDTV